MDQDEILRYCDSFNSPLGLTNGGNFTVAIRWDEEDLTDNIGDTIAALNFYIVDTSFQDLVVKVWSGSDANNLLYSDTVDIQHIFKWVVHNLTETLTIEDESEYWVGYEIIDQVPGEYASGLDKGPAVEGYGDMFYHADDGWITLSSLGISRNLLIEMKLLNSNPPQGCIGYNIYRMGADETEFSWYDFVDYDSTSQYASYIDYNVGGGPFYELCYQFDALWALNGDNCLSDFATSVVPIYDYVCFIGLIGTDEDIKSNSGMLIFPNPVSEKLSFRSEEYVYSGEIYNIRGQKVIDLQHPGKESIIDVSSLNPGLYILRIEMKDKVVHKRFLKVD